MFSQPSVTVANTCDSQLTERISVLWLSSGGSGPWLGRTTSFKAMWCSAPMVGEFGKAKFYLNGKKKKRGRVESSPLLQRHTPILLWASTRPHLLNVLWLSPAPRWETRSNMGALGNTKIQTVTSSLEFIFSPLLFYFCNCCIRVAKIYCWKHCSRMLVSEGTV